MMVLHALFISFGVVGASKLKVRLLIAHFIVSLGSADQYSFCYLVFPCNLHSHCCWNRFVPPQWTNRPMVRSRSRFLT